MTDLVSCVKDGCNYMVGKRFVLVFIPFLQSMVFLYTVFIFSVLALFLQSL
jgi:hypothetical protein